MSEQLTRMEDSGMSLTLAIDPERALENAKRVGDALMKIIERKDKLGEPLFYQMIGKNRHLRVEAWLTVAHFFGVTPRLVSVCSVLDEITGAAGFEAIVEAVHIGTGRVIGQAAARCLNNEDNWGQRPKYRRNGNERVLDGTVATPSYQLESMAQTRATSKVLASLFRWVVVLSGFSGTPAEETKGGTSHKENGEDKPVNTERISDRQRKQIFGAAKNCAYGYDKLPELFKRYGFEQAADITQEKFAEIIKEIEGHKAAGQ